MSWEMPAGDGTIDDVKYGNVHKSIIAEHVITYAHDSSDGWEVSDPWTGAASTRLRITFGGT